MFNTGDLGRWRDDGTLETLGRIDDQVKIKVGLSILRGSLGIADYQQGFRVELSSVATAIEVSHTHGLGKAASSYNI